MKEKSKSYLTSAKTMFAAMKILSKNGGTMPIRLTSAMRHPVRTCAC